MKDEQRATSPNPGAEAKPDANAPVSPADRRLDLLAFGLVAARLDETGPRTIRLRYLPRSFVVGLAVSVLSLVGWALCCRALAKRDAGPLPRAQASCLPLGPKGR